jgi:hypothetical protein
MSESSSRKEEHQSIESSVSPEKERVLQRAPRYEKNGPPESSVQVSGSSLDGTLFGAIHVDASGIVLEHRTLEGNETRTEAQSFVGREIGAIAFWAGEPAFVSALKSAIDSAKVSFHIDFKTSAASRERMIHVNILAVGDKTAWIFVSDKTLATVFS